LTRRAGKGAGRPEKSLSKYREMRDFGRTAEPRGGSDADAGRRRDGLRFVVQKHDASHLHYDLRLELDGVMRSWAVPRGPSLDPGAKRLAVQVEDHPMEYNAFEGTIPAAEYGGGTVMIWDRGVYLPEDEARDTAEETVRRGLRAGKLSFVLNGERLRGTFSLVRTSRGDKPQWLLIKQKDEHATSGGREITERVTTSVATGRTMEEIAGASDRVWRSDRGGVRGGEEEGAGAEATMVPAIPSPAAELPPDRGWSFEPWRSPRSRPRWRVWTRTSSVACASGRCPDSRSPW
jgi:bifunctional non-homologous end joining protein LigD